ncbi:unnamed protein product [Schistosoma rodhaini]|uniref:Uncharacterized protein n=1 Tax=Schistosoma rodhaini TaxID=6188 RepID=A0AA85FJ35_9TREM|nr:unnamed protein product [Schistosoma rodhaini]
MSCSQELFSTFGGGLSTRHQTGVHEDDQEHFQDINDIENKCRRIGVAGIELADLRDSTFNHVCHFTDSEITVGSAIQNTHILNDKGICKYEPLENNLGSDLAFSDSFTDSITFPVSSFQLGPSASRLNYVTIEQSSSCSNGDSLVPDLCAVEEEKQSTENKLNPSNSNCALSSNNSNQICKSETITSGLLKSTTSSTSAETKNTDFAQNLNARTVKPIYVNTLIKSFSGRNGRRAPVRRQFSETAGMDFGTNLFMLTFSWHLLDENLKNSLNFWILLVFSFTVFPVIFEQQHIF